MNQDALSLTGLRVGIFSQILLVLSEFDETSQTYDTRQEDIVNIFLRAAQLEAQVTESSGAAKFKNDRKQHSAYGFLYV